MRGSHRPQIGLTASFSELFPDSKPDKNELLDSISSSIVIAYLAVINSYLYQGKSDNEILTFVSRGWPDHIKQKIQYRHLRFKQKNAERICQLFNEYFITEFIMDEIINYRDIEPSDPTPQQEYNIFIAYLLNVDEVTAQISHNLNSTSKSERNTSQWIVWLIGLRQLEFSTSPNPKLQIIKAFILFSELLKNKATKEFCKTYLSKYNYENYGSLLEIYTKIFDLSELSFTEDNIPVFLIHPHPTTEKFLDQLSIDIKEVAKVERLQKNFIGLRAKPLFELKGSYVCLSWRYFINKLSSGLIFDFFTNSGIDQKFNRFPDFKSMIGSIIENRLFEPLVHEIFYKNHLVKQLPEKGEGPDAYIRNGKYIFIFEFKDALMPAEVIHNANFNDIEADLVRKHIVGDSGKAKGIGQLINHIKKIETGGFAFDEILQKGLKLRNIVIFPIIVYTDQMYSMHGINQYISEEFRRKYTNTVFEKVEAPVMISYDLLFSLQAQLDEIELQRLITGYNKYTKRLTAVLNKNPTPENDLKAKTSFEHSPYVIKEIQKLGKQKRRVFSLFETYRIDPNLFVNQKAS